MAGAIFASGGLPIIAPHILVGALLASTLGYILLFRPRVAPSISGLLFITSLILVSTLRDGPIELESVVSRTTNFLVAWLLLCIYLGSGNETFVKDLRALLKLLPPLAILTVILAFAAEPLFSEITLGEQSYYTIAYLLTFHRTDYDITRIIRPDGIFFEPGVFQIYLSLGALLELFVFRNVRRFALFGASVLLTQSTTGISILVVMTAAYLIVAPTRTDSASNRSAVKWFAILCIGIIIAQLFETNFNEKFSGLREGSMLARQYDFFTGINIAIANPLFGIGFSTESYLHHAQLHGHFQTALPLAMLESRPTSNGLAQSMYVAGIPFGLVLVFSLIRQRILPYGLPTTYLLLASLYTEVLTFTPFFLLVALSGISRVQGQPLALPREKSGL